MSERAAQRVGFVGLGAMGAPMARNLGAAGYELQVFDIVPQRVANAATWGAHPVDTPAAAASDADAVITMLPNGPDVEDVVLGSSGVAEGVRKGATLIEMSTIDPAVTRQVAEQLAARGAHMLDAPVGRTSRHAEDGDLAIMVGGDRALFERHLPLLDVLGSDITHCGPIGSGEVMKLVNNLLTTTIVAANAEALVLGAKAGLDVDTMLRVLRSTAASNTHLTATYPEKALRGDLSPGFATRLAHKDLGLAMSVAQSHRVSVSLGAAAAQLFALSRRLGHDDDDYTAILAALGELAGVEVLEGPSDRAEVG